MRILIMICAFVPAVFAQSSTAVDAASRVTAPALVYKTEPEYTDEARSRGIEGVTTLYIEVTKNGAVGNIKVVKSLDPGLDAKAVEAVRNWKFQPATKAGKPVTVSATIRVNFRTYPTAPSSLPPDPPSAKDESAWLPVFVCDPKVFVICIE
jgi:TonB family protein